MKEMKILTLPALFLLALFAVVPAAQASPTPFFPKEREVLQTITRMYAPTADSQSDWQNAVCENMTEGGCGYFAEHLASRFWQSGQDVALTSAIPGKVVAILADGSQVWKEEISIYKTCGEALEKCPSIESDIYLHVVYDETRNKWLLNRALYGPYIEE